MNHAWSVASGLSLLLLLPPGARAEEPSSPEVRTHEFLSDTYTVDRKYRSMMGPQSTRKLVLGERGAPELIWIIGYKARMVGADGQTPLSQEFMCHSNLDIDMDRHRALFGWKMRPSRRLFTLSQGQFEIRFPEGFGIPILSDEALSLTTQVLNLNEAEREFQVRHRVDIEYVRDADLTAPMQPLFMKAANGLVSLAETQTYYNKEHASAEAHGPGCMVGDSAGSGQRTDKFGQKFSGHWVVPPGKQVNRTLVTNWLNLPWDTRIHYIAVHLHPFAESLELRDLTDGKTIFKTLVRPSEKGIGIEHVDYFSSEQGLPIVSGHEYELVSVYNNTTDEDQDSMAVMYLYLHDREYQRPSRLTAAH